MTRSLLEVTGIDGHCFAPLLRMIGLMAGLERWGGLGAMRRENGT